MSFDRSKSGIARGRCAVRQAVPFVLAFVGAWSPTAIVLAEPPESVAGAGNVDEAIDVIAPAAAGGIPPDFPGQRPGPREIVAPTERPAVEESAREWFGGLPFLEWSRVTGDWGGIRTDLENAGITVGGSFTIEWANAISGGISRKWVSRNLFNLNVAVETEPLFGWKGGTFFVDVASSDSTEGGTFVPGTQWTSSIEIAGDTFQIANFWYEQQLFDGVLRLKAGKLDVTTEFGWLEATAGFINLGPVYPMTWPGVPTYPYSSLGGVAFLYPCDNFYVGGGAFDANFDVDQFFPADPFDDGTWAIGETGFTWSELGAVRNLQLSFGGWYDSRDVARFDGTGDDTSSGLYTMGQARFFAPEGAGEDDTRGLWVFGRWSWADPDVVLTHLHYGGGVSLHGTFPGRDGDKTGVYVGRVHYAGNALQEIPSEETAIDLFYALEITPAITFTPDIQFLLDPGGDDTVKDPIVFTMRLQMTF
jgi:porin